MEMKSTTEPPLNLPDIQGLLLHGYKHYDYIRHLILRMPSRLGTSEPTIQSTGGRSRAGNSINLRPTRILI